MVGSRTYHMLTMLIWFFSKEWKNNEEVCLKALALLIVLSRWANLVDIEWRFVNTRQGKGYSLIANVDLVTFDMKDLSMMSDVGK